MSILMAYFDTKTLHARQLDKAINTLNKAQCQLVTQRYNVYVTLCKSTVQ